MVLRIDCDYRMTHVIETALTEYVKNHTFYHGEDPCRCCDCLADLLTGEPHKDGCAVVDACEAIARIGKAPLNENGKW